MNKNEIKARLNNGFKIKVCLQPTKKHDKVMLKTWLSNDKLNIHYSIYYNHAKSFLSQAQIEFIEIYNTVKNLSFADKVNLNIKKHELKATKEDFQKIVMLKAINKIQYLES